MFLHLLDRRFHLDGSLHLDRRSRRGEGPTHVEDGPSEDTDDGRRPVCRQQDHFLEDGVVRPGHGRVGRRELGNVVQVSQEQILFITYQGTLLKCSSTSLHLPI